jgi:hypothetical protein
MEVARWSLAPAALGMLRRSTKGRRNDCFGPTAQSRPRACAVRVADKNKPVRAGGARGGGRAGDQVPRLLAAQGGDGGVRVRPEHQRSCLQLERIPIESTPMILRVEQREGRRHRYVMLSPQVLALLCAWSNARCCRFPSRGSSHPHRRCSASRFCFSAGTARHQSAMAIDARSASFSARVCGCQSRTAPSSHEVQQIIEPGFADPDQRERAVATALDTHADVNVPA